MMRAACRLAALAFLVRRGSKSNPENLLLTSEPSPKPSTKLTALWTYDAVIHAPLATPSTALVPTINLQTPLSRSFTSHDTTLRGLGSATSPRNSTYISRSTPGEDEIESCNHTPDCEDNERDIVPSYCSA